MYEEYLSLPIKECPVCQDDVPPEGVTPEMAEHVLSHMVLAGEAEVEFDSDGTPLYGPSTGFFPMWDALVALLKSAGFEFMESNEGEVTGEWHLIKEGIHVATIYQA